MQRLADVTAIQSQQEAELWEARAQVETLNMQLAIATSEQDANNSRINLAKGPQDGALSERVLSLINDLASLLGQPDPSNAGNGTEKNVAMYITFVRLLRLVVGQYRKQLTMYSSFMKSHGFELNFGPSGTALSKQTHGRGKWRDREERVKSSREAQQLSYMVEGDSFDSVNTGERDESAFWDVSTDDSRTD